MIRAFLKPLAALACALLLGGCAANYVMDDLSPNPAGLTAAKLPERYVVAVVGRFDEPIVLRGGNLTITLPVGGPLKTTLAGALGDTLTDPVFVPDEDAARGMHRNEKLDAIIVSFDRASASGTLRQAGFSSTGHVQVLLLGTLTIISRDGSEVTRSITAPGNRGQTSYAPHLPNLSKAAAEEAITYFARRVAAELRFLVTGTVASLEQ